MLPFCCTLLLTTNFVISSFSVVPQSVIFCGVPLQPTEPRRLWNSHLRLQRQSQKSFSQLTSNPPKFQPTLADPAYLMSSEQHMFTDQFLRSPGAIRLGFEINIFDILAHLIHNSYHKTLFLSSDVIRQ